MSEYLIGHNIRKQIAEAMIRESAAGWDRQHMGQSYAVDTRNSGTLDAVFFKEAQAPWNPWPDSATAFPVAALYQGSDADFSEGEDGFEEDAIFFALSELPETHIDIDAFSENFDALIAEAKEVESAN